MELTEKHFAAVVAAGLVNPSDYPSENELQAAAFDALLNEAPEVAAWDAEQDKGEYSVLVRGVPGAYFVEAMEHDELGVFSKLADAKDAAIFNFGEFFVSEED